jgi:type II secretory pathway predicted ATPase ExeA
MSAWVIDREEQEEIVDRTLRRMAGFHTRTSLAKHLALSYEALGQLLRRRTGHWNTQQHAEKRKILAALSAWLDSEEADDVGGFVSTPTFEYLQNAYNYAFSVTWPVLIVGEVGIGKSIAARYRLRLNPKTRCSPGVVYVELKTGDATRKAILARIVQALFDLEVILTMTGDPMTILKDNLGLDDLLIIDEFQFALGEDIKAGQVFHDIANSLKTHVVLQGNPSINVTLWSEKNQELEGLANRVLAMPHLSTTKEDVEAWMQWAGYEGESLIKVAGKVAARRGPSGGLRTLVILLDAIEKFFPDKKLTGQSFLGHARTFGKFSPTNRKGARCAQ